ncbi:MAG: hypothetical protein K6T66_00855 [Peptococcaceae bacterium]|nr:hypothetical protein [Peptococcaceae bacterium]
MDTIPGKLFSKAEVETACALIERTFGADYFRRGLEMIKDGGPSGAAMGRRSDDGRVSRLFLAWHGSREELAYADLQGYFAPGLQSAITGVLGKSLEALGDAPGAGTAARGLLDNNSFEQTFFLLWVAAGFKAVWGDIRFPGRPGECFFTGPRYAAVCLRTMGTHPRRQPDPPPLCSSIAGQLQEIRRLLAGRAAEGRSLLFYVDLSGSLTSLEEAGKILENIPGVFSAPGEQETAAVVLCKTMFSPGTGGVRWKTVCFPVFNQKNPGLLEAGGAGIYLP